MQAGEVTKAIHNLSVGDKVGIRAPMGCGFPVEAWKGKKILYVMGGIGSAALKATIEYTLEHRADYAGVSILYGATRPAELHLPVRHRRVAEAHATSTSPSPSTASATAGSATWAWCPTVLEEMNPDPANTIAITCGPPIMIKFALMSLQQAAASPTSRPTPRSRSA